MLWTQHARNTRTCILLSLTFSNSNYSYKSTPVLSILNTTIIHFINFPCQRRSNELATLHASSGCNISYVACYTTQPIDLTLSSDHLHWNITISSHQLILSTCLSHWPRGTRSQVSHYPSRPNQTSTKADDRLWKPRYASIEPWEKQNNIPRSQEPFRAPSCSTHYSYHSLHINHSPHSS